MYGIQTLESTLVNHGMFENDVKMYGIQTMALLEMIRVIV